MTHTVCTSDPHINLLLIIVLYQALAMDIVRKMELVWNGIVVYGWKFALCEYLIVQLHLKQVSFFTVP